MPPPVFRRFDANGTPIAPLQTRQHIVKRMVNTLHFQPEESTKGNKKHNSSISQKEVMPTLPTPPKSEPNPIPASKRKQRSPPENSNVIGMLPQRHKLQLAKAISKVVRKSQQNILKMFDRYDIHMLPIGVYNKGGGAIQIRPRHRRKEDQNAWFRKHFGG